MKPVVTFRCVVNGCGRKVAGLFTSHQIDGPIIGWYAHNSAMWHGPDHPSDSRWILMPNIAATDDTVRVVLCLQHGAWFPTEEELLAHWRDARAGGPPEIKLDRDWMKSLEDLPE